MAHFLKMEGRIFNKYFVSKWLRYNIHTYIGRESGYKGQLMIKMF